MKNCDETRKKRVGRDELIDMSQTLCYGHYMEEFLEFITDGSDIIRRNICPNDMNRLKKEFEEYMRGRKYTVDTKDIQYLCENADYIRLSDRLMSFFY